MIKTIILSLLGILFMYAAFASSHYLNDEWYETPTSIFMTTMSAIHFALLILNIIDNIKPNKKEKK